MDGSDKDGVTANAVHVDACAGLQVIQVDISKFGNEINDIILCTGLLIEEYKSFESASKPLQI